MDEADEDVLERALPGVQILEGDSDVAHSAEQGRDSGAVGGAVEHVEKLMTLGPQLELRAEGNELLYVFDGTAERTGIPSLLGRMRDIGIAFKDLNTRQSSLEDIFVSLVHEPRP